MNRYIKAIFLGLVIATLSGCYQIAADFWNGNYETERFRKKEEIARKKCGTKYPKIKGVDNDKQYEECMDREYRNK